MSTSTDDSKFDKRVRKVVEPIIDEEIVRFSHNLLASCVNPDPECKLPKEVRPLLNQIISSQTTLANKISEMKDEVRRIEYAVTDPTQEEADEEKKENPSPTDPWEEVDKLLDLIPDENERKEIMEFVKKMKTYTTIARGLQLGSSVVNLVRSIIDSFTTYNKVVELTEDVKFAEAEIQNAISSAQRVITDQALIHAQSLNNYLHTSFQGVFDGIANLGTMLEACCRNTQTRFNQIDDQLDEIQSAISSQSGGDLRSDMMTLRHQLNAERGFL